MPQTLLLNRLAICLTSLLLLSSCNPFQSTHLANSHRDAHTLGKARVGQFYFLPRARLKIEGKKAATGGDYEVTIERILEADPGHRYFLEYRPNVLFNDDIQAFKVNKDGLLTAVTLHTEDKTLAAINELTQAAINLYKISSGLPESGKRTEPGPEPFRVTFDPFSESEVRRASLAASRSGVTLSVHTSPLPEQPVRYLDDANGIYYHPPTVVGLTLDFLQTSLSQVFYKTITVPDPTVVATYAFKRNAFIKREQAVTFDAGMPSEMTLKKPSQVMGFSSGFKTITETVKDAVPELINVKVERMDREMQYMQKSQQLEQARMEYDAAARQKAGSPESGTPSRQINKGSNQPNHQSVGPPRTPISGDSTTKVPEPELPKRNVPEQL